MILGNGPSMRAFDLRQLEGRYSFCLNRGYLLWQEQGRVPDALVSVDRLVVSQFAAQLQSVGAMMFFPWLLRSHFNGKLEDIVFFEERWDDAFITDARHGLSSLSTVTNTALQLAYHMGFSTVILLGIDHYFRAEGPANQMVVQKTGDPDHFRADYFAPGTKWHLPDLDASERGYRLAKVAYEKAGRRIINATPGTRLEVFEKMPLNVALAVAT